MDESALVSGCIKGDNTSRKQLYERYAQRMMAICYRYLGNKDEAEDVLHDGFIRIFESIHSFQYRGEGSLRAWMTKIFINTALHQIKKQALWEPLLVEPERIEEVSVNEEELGVIPDEVLLGFISDLPAGYRTVLNQYVFDEMSHKEIALELGINESSSRSQLARAKAMLADKVKLYKEQRG